MEELLFKSKKALGGNAYLMFVFLFGLYNYILYLLDVIKALNYCKGLDNEPCLYSKILQEYEANLFSSQILLADDDVLPYIYDSNTQLEIALALCVDVNLVAMKIDTLIKQGHKLNQLEYKRNFM